jgi:hypothetical protein
VEEVPDPTPWPARGLDESEVDEVRERVFCTLYESARDEFLVEVCLCASFHDIFVEGLPALLELLALPLPLVHSNADLERLEEESARKSRELRRQWDREDASRAGARAGRKR